MARDPLETTQVGSATRHPCVARVEVVGVRAVDADRKY